MYVAVDSPVDLADIDFSSTITYASIANPTGNEEFEHHVRPHVEFYPYANLTTGAVQTALTGTHNVLLAVKAPQKPDGVNTVGAVITVKSANGSRDQDHHDARRAPRRHRRHAEPGLGATSPTRPTSGSR